LRAGVIEKPLLDQLRGPLEAIRPKPAVFDHEYVKRINGPNLKPKGSKMNHAEMLMEDIRSFRETSGASRVVMIWCGSTEVFHKPAAVHETLKNFECGLTKDDPEISPSQIYAYAALKSGVPYANGAPHLTVDTPALVELARERNLPLCGKDFKTGQTFMKTLVAPGLKSRMLGVSGWFSTNILGNRDGEVLDDPGSFKSKEESKLSALEQILQPDLYPDLYKNVYHKVRINYYPPRGDAKEGWDNIDIFGWPGLSDADQDRLPVPRFHPGRAPGTRPGAVFGSGAARRHARRAGVAVVLFQSADDRSRPLSRARHIHPVDETEKHAALDAR
jgi:myo-inositol-1-phosphate synthase